MTKTKVLQEHMRIWEKRAAQTLLKRREGCSTPRAGSSAPCLVPGKKLRVCWARRR